MPMPAHSGNPPSSKEEIIVESGFTVAAIALPYRKLQNQYVSAMFVFYWAVLLLRRIDVG
jgi:hypothetical protein